MITYVDRLQKFENGVLHIIRVTNAGGVKLKTLVAPGQRGPTRVKLTRGSHSRVS